MAKEDLFEEGKQPAAEKPAVNADKLKALRAAMDKIEKNYGKGSIMKLGDESVENIEVIPTGSIALIAAPGVGGYPNGRVIEIYLYTSVAPIPFATMTNREWGQIGTNYFRGLFALAFQAFLMMVCVAIYAVLVSGIAVADNLHTALWSVAAYTVVLCFSLFKTGSLAKSIWNAH